MQIQTHKIWQTIILTRFNTSTHNETHDYNQKPYEHDEQYISSCVYPFPLQRTPGNRGSPGNIIFVLLTSYFIHICCYHELSCYVTLIRLIYHNHISFVHYFDNMFITCLCHDYIIFISFLYHRHVLVIAFEYDFVYHLHNVIISFISCLNHFL